MSADGLGVERRWQKHGAVGGVILPPPTLLCGMAGCVWQRMGCWNRMPVCDLMTCVTLGKLLTRSDLVPLSPLL